MDTLDRKNITDRGFIKLYAKLEELGSEILAAAEMGKTTLTTNVQKNVFMGMLCSVERSYEKFVDQWDRCRDYTLDSDQLENFPNPAEREYGRKVKDSYYLAQGYYQSIKTNMTSSSKGSVTISNKPSLPPIVIKPFSGQISEWLHFKQIFTASVLSDDTLSDIEKFKYLLSYVTGPAHEKIKNIPVLEATFAQAWKSLDDLYSNERKLACHYLEKILTFKSCQGKPTFDQLQSYHSQITEMIEAFKSLKLPITIELGDYLLTELAIRAMDSHTREGFESYLANNEVLFPTIKDIDKFVERRCRVLSVQPSSDTKDSKGSNSKSRAAPKTAFPTPKTSLVVATAKEQPVTSSPRVDQPANNSNHPPCYVCRKPHPLFRCQQFLDASPQDRVQQLRSWNGCRNCLYTSHRTRDCPSQYTCRECRKSHHTLLHLPATAPAAPAPEDTATATPATRGTGNATANNNNNNRSAPTSHRYSASRAQNTNKDKQKGDNTASYLTTARQEVLLGTAMGSIQDKYGSWHPVRLMLDSCAQSSFISTDLVNTLGLHVEPSTISVTGIGETSMLSTSGTVTCNVQPVNGFSAPITAKAVILPKITSSHPTTNVPVSVQQFYQTFELADPSFSQPGDVDMILGADWYPKLITGAPIFVSEEVPHLIPSVFGHLVIGPYNAPAGPSSVVACFAATQPDLNLTDIMHKFWELEELPSTIPLTPDEEAAELHFRDTHFRMPCGRYVVCLAFKDGQPPALGPSKLRATTRFFNLEKTFTANPARKEAYLAFLNEYEELGHMSVSCEEGSYYIPHHGVFKEASGTSKIRVVFDGSAKTSTGSLNDYLLAGPKLQQDVCTVLLHFRRNRYIFSTDIVKMFRQVLIAPSDRKYQHILWRTDPKEKLLDFELNTITYGLKSSPYLSLRTVKQLSIDEGKDLPRAVEIINERSYVDDINGGGPDLTTAIEAKQQLIELLKRGGFSLSKWASNSPLLLDDVAAAPPEQLVSLQDSSEISILGLQWSPTEDILTYHVKEICFTVSRRAILSVIARLYDPLGLLAPVTFYAKIIMQETWECQGLDWDDPVPNDIAHRWLTYAKDLSAISALRLPRYLQCELTTDYLFVGFCDASSKGYCAAFYLVSGTGSNRVSHLIKSKTRLAPLKPVLTIPRLELCGALLLVRLFCSLSTFIRHFPTAAYIFFTDSSNVLGWLNTPVNNLLTFAAHRVSEILQSTSAANWRHVRSEDNPADLGSRGLLPSQLLNHSLWWNGPAWLLLDVKDWPVSSVDINRGQLPDLKKAVVINVAATQDSGRIIDWIENFAGGSLLLPPEGNRLQRLVRTFANLLRFVDLLRGHSISYSAISTEEYDNSLTLILKLIQQQYYPEAFEQGVTCTPFLRSLNIFLDEDGLLRVGGRLGKSDLPYASKHPILLPRRSRFNEIVAAYYHHKCLHAGSAAVVHALQQVYWLPGGRNLIKKLQRSCVTCLRFNSKPQTPFMADLPASRVREASPFAKVGVDYAGPFLCKASHLRKAPVIKVYLCLFICLATKAVHLEVADSLSTESFLDAFERFTSRRGIPVEVLSDCGTNFKGAANYIEEIEEWHSSQDTINQLQTYAAPRGISWVFNPPHTPHFGGIWESQVKSAKTLLRKTLGSHSCTSGELNTMFIRIEAIMNSRPLYALSTDPQDYEALTPAHFLIGRSLTALPEPDFTQVPETSLRRWQLIRQRTQFFWDRWHKEYLQTLQARQKWHTHRPNLQLHDLVLLAEDGVPPLHWPLGRIINLSPGSDNIVRVVRIRTAKGECTRPVAKIVLLIPQSSQDLS